MGTFTHWQKVQSLDFCHRQLSVCWETHIVAGLPSCQDDVWKHWWSEFRCAIHGAEARSKRTSTRSEGSKWYSKWDKCWVMDLSFMLSVLFYPYLVIPPCPLVCNFTSCLGLLSPFRFSLSLTCVFSLCVLSSQCDFIFMIWVSPRSSGSLNFGTLDLFAVHGPCLFVWCVFPGFDR